MIDYYTGVGSRETPLEILKIMAMISRELEKSNILPQNGGA